MQLGIKGLEFLIELIRTDRINHGGTRLTYKKSKRSHTALKSFETVRPCYVVRIIRLCYGTGPLLAGQSQTQLLIHCCLVECGL